MQFTPFSKECSAIWKTTTEEEKQKFQKLAEDDRERYKREVSGFEKPLAKDGTRRGRRKKEPGQPKRNMLVTTVHGSFVSVGKVEFSCGLVGFSQENKYYELFQFT